MCGCYKNHTIILLCTEPILCSTYLSSCHPRKHPHSFPLVSFYEPLMEIPNIQLSERQILGPIFSGILGPITTKDPLGSVTSILPPILPLPTSSSTSVLASSTESLSTSSASTSSASTSSTKSSEVSSAIATATPSSVSEFETTSAGKIYTVTTVIALETASVTPTLAAAPKSFLQNKVASGVVFALVGLIGLVIIVVVGTFAIRRRRQNMLHQEAISFDPGSTTRDRFNNHSGHSSLEKPRVSSSTGHGRDVEQGNRTSAAPFADYRPNAYFAPLPTIPRTHNLHDGYSGHDNYAQQTQNRWSDAAALPNPHLYAGTRSSEPVDDSAGPLNSARIPGDANTGPPVGRPLPPSFGSFESGVGTVNSEIQYQHSGPLKIANE
ncbi:hypothetical protein BDQ12DRAFT_674888 [Crucibulum laeve]|uniref:Mid2 domain-containing protein n=1 Tax=Crucibulum laeve TaxID=68775 RepID=A0A5C3MFH0_9AGAR|nr:hypothetical protein BDQ12DRAFT_674888 [Crucibulum laeve]